MAQTTCLRLMEDPDVFAIFAGGHLYSGLAECLKEARGKPFHLLVVPNWDLRTQVGSLAAFVRTAGVLNPGISICILSPGAEENALLQSKSLRHIHAHHNAFIDEAVFFPQPGVEKRYDAVHVAALQSWKRHDLAWHVPNLCLITYAHGHGDDIGLLQGYSSLAYCNATANGKVSFLGAADVARKINESRAGLILSALEGGNFASGEYQFCGLPVITTPSRGGRHYFLDEETTVMTQAVPGEVERAVAETASWDLDACAIHQRAVARAIPHRERLLDYLSQISGRNLRAEANRNAWHPAFRDKLHHMRTIETSAP